MPRKLKEEFIHRARSLVLQQGLKGGALAEALGVDERTARAYARYVRQEAEHAAANGSGSDQTPLVEPCSADAARIEEVPLEAIDLTAETQARERLVWSTVEEYAERRRAGDDFPPVTLFYDGRRYYIGDGHHRVAAARQVDATTITAEVKPGDERAARLYAAGANLRHGLKRSNADKRKAVMILLADPLWRRRADSSIARYAGVDPKSVKTWRAEVTQEIRSERTYINKYGQEATMDTTHIGRRAEAPARAPEPPAGETQPKPSADQPAEERRRGEIIYHRDTSHTGSAAPAKGEPYQIIWVRDEPVDPPPGGWRPYTLQLELGNLRGQVEQYLQAVERQGGLTAVLADWTPAERRDFLEAVAAVEAKWTVFAAEVQRAATEGRTDG